METVWTHIPDFGRFDSSLSHMNYNEVSVTPFQNLPLLGFDTETTGVNIKEDRVITCNITYSLTDGVFNPNDWILQPSIDIPQGASDVHGITTEFAREYGQEPREALQEIHDHLAAWESYGLPLVAYNAAYDCSILTYEWARHGIKSVVRFNRVIDPFVLDKQAYPYRKGSRKLTRLAEIYGVDLGDAAHAADADVMATLQVARLMPHAFPKDKIDLDMPLDRLHAHQVLWKYEQAQSLQEYFRKKEKDDSIIVNGEWPVIYGETGN